MDSYDPNTIQSQFNHAHIIIYPQSSGLCHIQICKKFKVPIILLHYHNTITILLYHYILVSHYYNIVMQVHFFGPLVNGMLVSKKILPFLVRQTAINANKRVRERTAGYNKPYHH